MNKILIGLLSLACIAMGFCFGVGYGQETFEPQQIEVPIITTTFVITPPNEVIVEVEKLVARPKPRGFRDEEELQDWLDSKEIVRRFYIGTSSYQCEDYCAHMIQEAVLDGYVFSQEGIMRSYNEAHILCKTWIDGEWIYVESQTREIVEKDWR